MFTKQEFDSGTSADDNCRSEVLFASDFSLRSDRAEERAFERAAALGTDLRIVALDGKGLDLRALKYSLGTDDPKEIAALLCEVHRSSIDFTVRVELGGVTSILQQAASAQSRVIVLGSPDHRSLRQSVLGTLAERVVHRASVPVLVVRRRSNGPYCDVAILTDSSTESRTSILHASKLVMDSRSFAILHAYRVPFEVFLSRSANDAEFRERAVDEFEGYVQPFRVAEWLEGRVSTELLYGAPDEALARYVSESPVDLVIVAAHGVGGLLEGLRGGPAEPLLRTLNCDVMVAGKSPP